MAVVQCKRWNAPIGEPELRDFYGAVINVRANFGYFVTSSSFTTQAQTFAENKPIELIDIDALVQSQLDSFPVNQSPSV